MLSAGTFCALDICLSQLQDVGSLNVCQTVRRMRTQRAFSIQTPDQYYFCYNAILEHAQRQGLLPTNQWASALTSQTSPWTLRSLQSICKLRAVLCDQLVSPGKFRLPHWSCLLKTMPFSICKPDQDRTMTRQVLSVDIKMFQRANILASNNVTFSFCRWTMSRKVCGSEDKLLLCCAVPWLCGQAHWVKWLGSFSFILFVFLPL